MHILYLSTFRKKAHKYLCSWANNRYPGVACDIPTAFYSLSFAQEYWSGRALPRILSVSF